MLHDVAPYKFNVRADISWQFFVMVSLYCRVVEINDY